MEIKCRIAMLLMIIMAVNGVRAQKYKPINPVKGFIITHRCKKCGAVRRNKSAKDDDEDLLIKLTAMH